MARAAHRGRRRTPRRALVALLLAGAAIRLLCIAILEPGFDAGDTVRVGELVAARGFETYGGLGGLTVWPYPPAWFGVALLGAELDGLLGLRADQLVRLPAVAAELALAALVARRAGLAAGALVALGPAFVLPSAVVGQFDAVVLLLVIAALDSPALRGGLLGAAIALKGYPVLFLAALAPLRRPVRTLLHAVAVPLAVTLPFLIATPEAVLGAAGYQPLPGVSGLSLVLQPELAGRWVTNRPLDPSPLLEHLLDLRLPTVLTLAGMAATALWAARQRPAPLHAALVAVLVFWVLCTTFYWQYLTWGLPLLLLAGRVRAACVLQLVALPGLALVIVARTEHLLDDGGGWATIAGVLAATSGITTWLVMVAILFATLRTPPTPALPARRRTSPSVG